MTSTTTWSVCVRASGDRVLTQDEIVELADAVIPYDGIASGIGSTTYGVQILVEAPSRDEAETRACELFAAAAATAGLPDWPVSEVEVLSEEDELEELAQQTRVHVVRDPSGPSGA